MNFIFPPNLENKTSFLEITAAIRACSSSSEKKGATFLLEWFRHASQQTMAFVDIQQLILVCNEASHWFTALGTVSPEGDRTQGKFCFVHLENLLRTVTSG